MGDRRYQALADNPPPNLTAAQWRAQLWLNVTAMAVQLTCEPAYGTHGPAHQQPPARAGPQPTQLSCAMLRTWLQRYIGLPALPSVAEAARPANLLAALARLQPEAPGTCATKLLGGAAQREQEEVYVLAGEPRPSLHTRF